ncbi:Outer membrane protein TolC [Catalinimonas alkaloidigena]|uniref:Outer membrane protein TolC n=1 Tax=Catalinimonas alkaloidigena TaxID=1075417 RepID=A0A1G9AVX8_9BACT|nr:TolC family protein [Catalinimonas alkaloidigena]SDK30810.1 Outer membrane protein TolC [Catalinimonas alkaloidigena]
MNLFFTRWCLVFCLLAPTLSAHPPADSLGSEATLDACIRYALLHQPALRQTALEQEITNADIRIRLSDWLPQVGFNYYIQHYLKLPVSAFPDPSNPDGPRRIVTIGLKNTSALQFSASQTLFSADVLFASRTARDFRAQSYQQTQTAKIDLTVDVSKAFYNVLLTQQQTQVLQETIARLERNLKDAYSQYQAGITDKIDYKRATISLNNARAQLKGISESLEGNYALLKQLMGYPHEAPLQVVSDTAALQQAVPLDTLQQLQFENRVEYQLAQTNLRLQRANVAYNRQAFLPSLSAFLDYNMLYQNDQISEIYSRQFPNSVTGLRLALPILQGGRRLQNIQRANLVYQQSELQVENIQNQINTEYTQALATYKSNLADLQANEENLTIAREVYTTVKLQYDEGIKTYLEVIVSETDLRTAELNRLNALYQVLSAKLDVQRALGTLSPDQE